MTATTSPETAWAPQEGPQEAAIRAAFVDELFYGGAAGGGKILRRGTPVLTPFGWRNCEELEVGSRINAPDGTTCRIIQLHPWVRLPGVRVTFHDGTSTTVAWDHLWLAWRSGKRKKRPQGGSDYGEGAAEVIETRELAQWLKTAQDQQARGVRPNWPCIPACQPQPFNVQRRHPIRLEPYQLGLWLGDGHANEKGVRLTSEDTDHILKFWPEMRDWGGYAFGLTGEHLDHWRRELVRAGLMGTKSDTKFIPDQYLWASIADRRAILQGLMDTDGTADSRGQCYYTSISKRLVDGVCHLVQSLGGTATVTDRVPDGGQRAYTAYIKLPDDRDAFRLERKRSRCSDEGNLYRRVVSVEEVEEIEGRCITVSHPSGLYITNDFIVTHNSDFLLGDFAQGLQQGAAWQGVLFRQSFPSLADLVERSQQIYPLLGGKWLEGKSEWRFNNGAVLRFRQFENVNEFVKFQGHSYSWIGWDELPEWPDDRCYRRMISRLRGKAQFKRIRATGNPGGVGHGWVQERFKIPNEKVEWYDCDPFEVRGMVRMFVPSLLEDNKILMRDDPDYEHRLEEVGDPELVRAWKEGDWNAIVGAYYGRNWGKVELIDSFDIPQEWPIFTGLDYGEAEPSACIWGARDYDKNLILFNEYYQVADSATEHAQNIVDTARDYPFTTRKHSRNICDPNFFVRRRVNEAPVNTAAENFDKAGFRLQRGNNNRINGWRVLNDAMSKGKLKIFKEWCPNLIRTLPKLPRDPKKPEDIQDHPEDHLADALRYMAVHIFGRQQPKNSRGVTSGDRILKSLEKPVERRFG